MRTRAAWCALACAAVLGAHGARANTPSACPPSCNQLVPAPHMAPRTAQPPHGLAPPSHPPNFFMNPGGFARTQPPIGAPPPRYAQAGYPAAPAAGQRGGAQSAPGGQHSDLKPPPAMRPEFAMRPGFTGVQSPAGASPPAYTPPALPPSFAAPPGFTGAQSPAGASPPPYAPVGYPAMPPATPSGSAPSTPGGQRYSTEFAIPPGFTPAQPRGGTSPPAYAPVGYPASPSAEQPTVPPSPAPVGAAEPLGFAGPPQMPLTMANQLPPSPVVYACHTPVGICPVAFSGPAESGSVCTCIDPSTGRQDNGAIQ